MLTRFQSSLVAKTTIFIAAFLIFSTHAYATGALDPTFGTNGKVTTSIGDQAFAAAAALQADGKIIVAGNVTRLSTGRDMALVRYNPDGSLDTSFGNGGKVVTAISARDEHIFAVAVQSNGEIVVVGNVQAYNGLTPTDFLVVRFTADGGLDTSFGNNGVYTLNQGSTDVFNAVAVQPDGKIVAAGRTSDGGRGAVIRISATGQLDTTFGASGLLFLDVPFHTEENFSAIALLSNGRILVGGLANINDPQFPNWYSNVLVLMESNGALVQDFGLYHGFAASPANHPVFGFDLAVLPDGKILTVGAITARFLSNGLLDETFRIGPMAVTEIGVRSDGRFIIAGNNDFFNFEARAHTSDGLLIGGAKLNIGSANNMVATDILIQPDDKAVFINSTDTEFVTTRLLSITSQGTRLADFDRDGQTDISVFRPSNNSLYVLQSMDSGFVSITASATVTRVIPERTGTFTYWSASVSPDAPAYFYYTSSQGVSVNRQWGLSSDIPVGGDYDRDSYLDFTVFRPSNGTWYILRSSDDQSRAVQFGQAGDKPVPADYDYDGITDIAVYRPSNGTWYILRSSDGGMIVQQFGLSTDIPLTGDFDGDGRADFVVYRPSNGTWYLLETKAGFRAVQFGISTDQPVPGDYDGDGRHDIAVFRQGLWYVLGSTRGSFAVQWGLPGDVPVAVRYAY